MKKISMKIGAISLVGVLCISTLTGCGNKKSGEETTTQTGLAVNTMTISHSSLYVSGEFSGVISSKNSANVIPTAAGMVEEIFVEVGDFVTEGDVLFTINDDSAQLNYDKAQVSVNQANASKNQSIINAEKSVISAQSSYDTLASQKDAAVQQADSAISKAQADLNAIAAPVLQPDPDRNSFATGNTNPDGTPEIDEVAYQAALQSVHDANTKAQNDYNTAVAAAQSVLSAAQSEKNNVIADYDNRLGYASQTISNAQSSVSAAATNGDAQVNTAAIGVETAALQLEQYSVKAPMSGMVSNIAISEDNIATNSTIACVISEPESLQVTFGVSEYVKNELTVGQQIFVSPNGVEYSGIITEIAPIIDSKSQLYTITADVNATSDELPINVNVKVRADRKSLENTIVIPYSAIQFSADKSYVYVVEDGMAVQKQVTVGSFDNENVEIIDGLNVEEVLITSWSQSLRNGLLVEIESTEEE